MAERIAGTCFFKVDGTQVQVAGDITVDPLLAERTGQVGLSGIAGFKEMPRVPSIEVEFFVTRGTNWEQLVGTVDGTTTAELANGQVWSLRNSWLSGAPTLNADESKTTFKFEGESCEQTGSGGAGPTLTP